MAEAGSAHRGGAIEADVANDDVLGGFEIALLWRVHDDDAAGEALGHIVIGVSLQLQRDARTQPGAHALPGMPSERHVDRIVRQARAAKALSHLQPK